jgi:hypothetical protein
MEALQNTLLDMTQVSAPSKTDIRNLSNSKFEPNNDNERTDKGKPYSKTKKLLQSTNKNSNDQPDNISLIIIREDRNQITGAIPKANTRYGIPIDCS